MYILQILVIFYILLVSKIKCEHEMFEFNPCIGVEKIIETFNNSDPFAFNVTILFSKFDLIPDRLDVELKFDALSNITYVCKFFFILLEIIKKKNDYIFYRISHHTFLILMGMRCIYLHLIITKKTYRSEYLHTQVVKKYRI